MWEWKEKQVIMRHYDRQAAIYDVQYLGEQNAKIDAVLDNIEFDLNEIVLDAGCGTGFLFQHITQKVELLVGIDVSRSALIQAKKRTKNMPNIALIRADTDNTPFPDHILDKVFAITVLQNMPNPTKTIIEMKRMGKTKAIFIVTGLKKKYTAESFVELLEKARVRVVKLITNQQLKGYIALCKNIEAIV
jgi:ubiquinone/menaquinone biosynthesis C-methylase UbiE